MISTHETPRALSHVTYLKPQHTMKDSVISNIRKKAIALIIRFLSHSGNVPRSAVLAALACVALVSAPGLHAQTAVLEYLFDETASTNNWTAENTGSSSGNDLTMYNSDGNRADLHGSAGSGVSGTTEDLSFDNSASSGMGSSSNTGGYASGTVTLGTLTAFTISGWFKTDGVIIGNDSILVEGGGIKLKGFTTAGGRLSLAVNGTSIISLASYTAISEWVYFAVTYDSTLSTNNVSLYVGDASDSSSLTLVQTTTLNAGTVTISASTFLIGGHYYLSPFDGDLDNIRLYDSALSAPQLEAVREADIAIPESGATSVTLGVAIMVMAWARRRRR